MMKRVLLFTLLVSFFGYSQNPIQPNHSSFNDGLTQDLVEKTKPFDLEFKDDEMMDTNSIGRVNGMKPQSFQKPGNVQENEFKLRLFHYKGGTFSKENKQPETQYERFYDEDGNITLEINENWDIETQSYVIIDKKEYTYDENGNHLSNLSILIPDQYGPARITGIDWHESAGHSASYGRSRLGWDITKI